ncbi:energy-coupled thiamine transporter ThiT [Veillonella sp.]|jgi:probable proton-coupled thiamine transporter yuaJ|uniref:energy-coupled thiamine transporter ThiT n=1 Tax=Veillonella sp. TaxID=1926307 RepID=UPI00258AC1A8|nr:energy-coupled thiamine transporter ThiT [Veillonella sp.]MDU5084717.1 energy-coupled thiamine transporter ThiT [Veillonella sp.]
MGQSKTRMIAEAGVAIAIAQVLSFITLFHMPQGGSIKAASLVPLMIFAYRWGGTRGIWAGVVYGVLHFLLGFKSSIHYLSIILDYLLAYGAIGVCGYFKDNITGLVSGSIVAIALRWFASVTSGAVVFASYAPQGQNPWIYSMIYNASYMVPDGILNIIVLLFVYQGVKRGLNRSA